MEEAKEKTNKISTLMMMIIMKIIIIIRKT